MLKIKFCKTKDCKNKIPIFSAKKFCTDCFFLKRKSYCRFKTHEEYLNWYRQYREKNRKKLREYNKKYNSIYRKKYGYYNEERWIKQNPEKHKIHRKTQKMVKLGKIKKLSCKECGDKNSVAHHPDYSKPLEVIWLCRIHHRKIHYLLGVNNKK